MKSKPLICLFLLGMAMLCAYTQSQSTNVTKTDSLTQSSQVQTSKPVTDVAALAKKQFEDYKPKLEDSDFQVGYTKVFTGDFTGDNQKDVAIYYSLGPRDGGNMVAGMGLALYKGEGDKVQFLMKYNIAYPAYCDTIKNGKIYLWKTEYKKDDPRCCPSIKHAVELSYSDNHISEKRLN